MLKNVKMGMKHYLKEAMDDEFSFNRLRILPIKERIQYCREHLGNEIGCGSSRMVFQLSDEWVLKLAINPAGAAQNEAEIPDGYQASIGLFCQVDKQHSDLQDYYFIVSEYVLPLKEEDLNRCLNIDMSWEEFREFIYQSASQYDENAEHIMTRECEERNRANQNFMYQWLQGFDFEDDEEEGNSEWQNSFFPWDEFDEFTENDSTLNSINNFLTNFQFDGWGDWTRIVNVGMALRDGKPHIVFLDSGFNGDVRNKFYGINGDVGKFNDTNEHWNLADVRKKILAANNLDECIAYACSYFLEFIKSQYPYVQIKSFENAFKTNNGEQITRLMRQCFSYPMLHNFVKLLNDVINKDNKLDDVINELGNKLNVDVMYENRAKSNKRILDEIVSKNLNNYLSLNLCETINNEDAMLYHFTTIDNLYEIFKIGKLLPMYWGHVSFTRNRNSESGYQSQLYGMNRYIMVRLSFQPSSLMQIRNGSLENYSFDPSPTRSNKAKVIDKSRWKSTYPLADDEAEERVKCCVPLKLCSNIDIYIEDFGKDFPLKANWDIIKILAEGLDYSDRMRIYGNINDFNFMRNEISYSDYSNLIDSYE